MALKLGFRRTRQTGSREPWQHPDGRAAPYHCTADRRSGRPCSIASSANRASMQRSSLAFVSRLRNCLPFLLVPRLCPVRRPPSSPCSDPPCRPAWTVSAHRPPSVPGLSRATPSRLRQSTRRHRGGAGIGPSSRLSGITAARYFSDGVYSTKQAGAVTRRDRRQGVSKPAFLAQPPIGTWSQGEPPQGVFPCGD